MKDTIFNTSYAKFAGVTTFILVCIAALFVYLIFI